MARKNYNIKDKNKIIKNKDRRIKERLGEMDRKEFLAELDSRVKAIIKTPIDAKYLDELKERLLPIIYKEFLESVPSEATRGNKIRIESKGFELKVIGEIYYLFVEEEKLKIGSRWQGFVVLRDELLAELTRFVGREVKVVNTSNALQFYFFY